MPYNFVADTFHRCYGWSATSEYRWISVISLQRGPVDPKFQVEGVTPTNHSFCQKTRLNDLLYGVEIWTDFLNSVLSQCTRLTDWRTVTDWRTDGQTEFSLLDRVCIPCNAVKMVFFSGPLGTCTCLKSTPRRVYSALMRKNDLCNVISYIKNY